MSKPKEILELEEKLGFEVELYKYDGDVLVDLDLSFKQISDLSLLNHLTSITSLNLRGTKINDITALSQFARLNSLNLNSTMVTNFSQLSQIKSLYSLNLQDTFINDLSPLSELDSLGILNLTKTKIENIGDLKNLTRLRLLYLSETNVKNITHIKNFTQLHSLDISNTQISDISALSELSCLELLFLSNSQIIDISALSRLIRLTTLYLTSTKITDISALSGLSGLTTLDLRYTQITDISALSALSGITSLYLSSTQITDISALSALSGLTTLDLSSTQITDISALKNLLISGKLKNLDFSGSPIVVPPQEVLSQGMEAIAAYFEDVDSREKNSTSLEKCPLNEIRVIIIGDGKIGKTTLKKRLLGQAVSATEGQTDGIDIEIWQPVDLNGIKLRLWDFGGQEIQHSVHKLFLQDNCIYLLVLDKRKDQQYSQDIVYWMDHIRSFGGNSPVLIVENCIDTLLDMTKQYSAQDIEEIITINPEIENYYKKPDKPIDIVGVSALHNINIDALKHKLFSYVEEENNKGQYFKDWLNAKDTVEANITGGTEHIGLSKTNYISKETFDLVCYESGVTSASSHDVLLGVMVNLGVVFYYKSNHSSWLILNPEWATVAMYSIILDPIIKKNNGRLTKDEIEALMVENENKTFFSKKKYQYSVEEITYILSLMRDYELCYTSDDEEYFFPLGFNNNYRSNFKSRYPDYLCNIYEYKSLPKSLWYQLLTRLQKRRIITQYWQTGIEVSMNGYNGLVEFTSLKENRINIYTEDNDEGKDLRELIRLELQFVNEEFTNIGVTEEVLINGQDIKYNTLLATLSEKEEYNEPFAAPFSITAALEKYEDAEYTAKNLLKALLQNNDKLAREMDRAKDEIENLKDNQKTIIEVFVDQIKKGGPVIINQISNQNYNQNVNINENRLELPHDINALEGKLNFILNELKNQDEEKEKIKEILQSIEALRQVPTKEQAVKKGFFDKFKKLADYMKSGSDLVKALDNLKDYVDIDKIREGIELILRTMHNN